MTVTRVPKLAAADLLGVSPRTVDRMIARGELDTEREETGRRRVMVLIEEDGDGSNGEGRGNGTSYSPQLEGWDRSGRLLMAEGDLGVSNGPSAESLELIAARERIRSLEELTRFHKDQLNLAEERNQHLVQLLRSSQESVERLTLALPPGRSRPWWKFWE